MRRLRHLLRKLLAMNPHEIREPSILPMEVQPTLPDPRPAAVVSFFRPMAVGVVLLNLLVIGANVLSMMMDREQMEDRAAVVTRNLAQVLDLYVASAIDKVDLALLDVVDEAEKQLAGGGVDGPALNAFIARQRVRQPDLDSLRVTDANGTVLYGIGVNPAARVSGADRDYFIRLRDDPGAGLVFSTPVLGRISGKMVVILGRRISRPDRSFGGIAYAPIAVEHFNKMFSSIDVGRKGGVALRDANLGLIARNPTLPDGNGARVSNELRQMVGSGQTSGTYHKTRGSDDIERIVSYRKVGTRPLYVIVGLASDDYLVPWWGEVVQHSSLTGLFALISFVWAWMFYRIWVRKAFTDRLEHQVEERTAQLRTLAIELTMAEERERHAIAQDLHDDLGQTLAISKLKLTSLETPGTCEYHDDFMRQLKEVETMIDQANRSVRSLSLQLSPPVLHQFGLVPALEWLADEMDANFGLNVSIRDDGEPKLLDEISGNMLFRAVRELLINVHKHAEADAADVSISVNGDYLIISVTDTGVGFDAKNKVAPATGGGYGLFSVSERIRYFGGEMQIDSSPGDGTVVVLILPYGAQKNEVGQ